MGENVKITNSAPAASLSWLIYLRNLAMMVRAAHWAKNLFLFIPLFFAGKLFSASELFHVFWGVIAFSLTASGIYVLNDIKDKEKDQLHPVKQHRVIASGKISMGVAIPMMLFCMTGGMLLGWVCGLKFLLVLALYLLLNIGYSFGLKNIPILDIMVLAAGFVLRIKAGGVVARVGISQWLMIMVFLLALFLALGKRRDDILVEAYSGNDVRPAISGYNLDFLNTSLAVVSAVMIMAYIMYTLSPEIIQHIGTYRLYYTGIFVFAGILRYLQLIYVNKDTRSPTRILYKDHFIQLCIVFWSLSFYCLIYLKDLSFSSL